MGFHVFGSPYLLLSRVSSIRNLPITRELVSLTDPCSPRHNILHDVLDDDLGDEMLVSLSAGTSQPGSGTMGLG